MATMGVDKTSALQAGVVRIGHFRVNRLGFGAMHLTGKGIWGPPHDLHTAKKVLCKAVELDVNFIDTADAYGPYVSESLIQEMLYPYDGLIIATKGGMVRTGPDQWRHQADAEHLRAACLSSLERLKLKQITLYQLHWPDPEVPFMESVRALIDLQRQGLIRHIGLSNVTLEQLKQALDSTEIVSVQNPYNLAQRSANDSMVDFCEQQGIAFIPYFPMGGSGKLLHNEVLQMIADRHQASTNQISLAWLLARSKTMLPIPGTHSLSHLEENVAAASISLSDVEYEQLCNLERA